MAAFLKTYCMVSWPLEVDALDAHSCYTETLWSMTWRLWVLTQRPGKTLQLIGHNGEEPWPSTSKQEKRSWHKPPQRGGPTESFVSPLSNRQHTHATLATRTAIHASVFTVIVADAPAKHTTRMLYPWLTLTDRGLLLRPSPFFFSFTVKYISWFLVGQSVVGKEKKRPKKYGEVWN